MDDIGQLGAVAFVAALMVAAIALLLMMQLSRARATRHLRGRISGVRARAAGAGSRTASVANVRKDTAGKYPAFEGILRHVIPRPALLRYRFSHD